MSQLPTGRHWAASYDAFRRVPNDLSEASTAGACMTIVAWVVCATLFLCETAAFLSSKPTTRITIDTNEDPDMKINLDVTMYDMACDHVVIGAWNAFGTERMNITHKITKTRIDHKGDFKGVPYEEEQLVELEFSESSFTKEELAELDSDWSSSSDSFRHNDFTSVIEAHDFTVINFYADWCPHCKLFAPKWKEFEDKVNSGELVVVDADGGKANVRVLKVNCVDFEEACSDERIQGFPTVRMYRRGVEKKKSYSEYEGRMGVDGIVNFMKEEAGKRHLHAGAQYHNMFSEGCRIVGTLFVARVPGTIHLQGTHTNEKTMNLAFTNVSHLVNHFSFGESPRRLMSSLPKEYRRHVNPLDGMAFTVDKFHKAPNHFIKVVHTTFESSGLRSYQQTHQWSVRTLQRSAIPQAKFSYDLSPVEVVISKGDRRWYDFVTQIFAIIGGAYSVMFMVTRLIHFTSSQTKAFVGKLG